MAAASAHHYLAKKKQQREGGGPARTLPRRLGYQGKPWRDLSPSECDNRPVIYMRRVLCCWRPIKPKDDDDAPYRCATSAAKASKDVIQEEEEDSQLIEEREGIGASKD